MNSEIGTQLSRIPVKFWRLSSRIRQSRFGSLSSTEVKSLIINFLLLNAKYLQLVLVKTDEKRGPVVTPECSRHAVSRISTAWRAYCSRACVNTTRSNYFFISVKNSITYGRSMRVLCSYMETSLGSTPLGATLIMCTFDFAPHRVMVGLSVVLWIKVSSRSRMSVRFAGTYS